MLKMQELTKLTNTPKSTILYYIKEGILPKPQKPKPNLHLYDDSMVEAIKFIQYLQDKFNSSIAEIRDIFLSKDFDINNPYETLLHVLDLTLGKGDRKSFSKKEVENLFSKELVEFSLSEGFIYLRDGVFTQTEVELLEILNKLEEDEFKLVKEYIVCANRLAHLEVEIGKSALNKEDKNQHLKRFFDMILVLKPYIFNFKILSVYKERR